ncbi:MAG: hypothetical protein H0X37_20640 [Herpetosiphonaceae bacterium]|nr:hypothetical protein [Herpetosiphonaceae bacterium]
MKTITIFRYLDELDCFVVSDTYKRIAAQLGLTEWSPVVWIGRLFMLDNDYGEHWFDNWHLREVLESEATRRGLAEDELLIIDPDRFQNSKDGPCHPPAFRKRFWTDVLRSLELSFDLIADEARAFNERSLQYLPDEYIHDLESRIVALRAELEAR